MRRAIRTALLGLTGIAIALSSLSASAIEPCNDVARTITISGRVTDPHGNPVPSYPVIATREGGVCREQTTTDANGSYTLDLPFGDPTHCYYVMGQADEFYAQTKPTKKLCGDTRGVNLLAKYRISLVGHTHSRFIVDDSKDVLIPVIVYAHARTPKVPFAPVPLAWVFRYEPLGKGDHELLGQGALTDPEVRQIREGVWEYRWVTSVTLPARKPGHYDMDWGAKADPNSIFNPMMECLMVWFGFGITGVSPSEGALPGQVVTVSAKGLGDARGEVILYNRLVKDSWNREVGAVPSVLVLSWSDTEVRFLLPADARTGWLQVKTGSGARTNRFPITVGAAGITY